MLSHCLDKFKIECKLDLNNFLKQFPLILIVNHINNSIDHAKIWMTLLVHIHLEELIQLLITLASFLFTALFAAI